MHTQLSFWSPICFDPFKKCSFVKVCANMQNLDSLKLRLKTLQVWMDNVPSDVLIEDLIARLAWPAHNRAYLIPRPFIRHRLHWSLYNYIMYLGQESSILYFIYWVQLLIKKRHWKHCSLLCPFKDLKSSNLVLLGNFWLSVGSKMLPVPATHL